MFRCIAPLLLAAALPASELFDGKSLAGWKVCNGFAEYRAENGEIVGTTKEGSPNSFLCSERTFGDFVLDYDTKTDPRLNSGVQIRAHRYERETEVVTENKGRRVNKQPAGRVYGYQVETATAASGASGSIYDEARRGWVANMSKEEPCRSAFQDNEWNCYKVEAIGDRIRTWVNGVACVDMVDPMDLSGFIGLQVHSFKGDSPAEVRWRNLKIKELGRHGWRPLEGWKHEGGGKFEYVDGAWKGTHAGGGTDAGYLVSQDEFEDFTVRMKYRIVKGNSGVFFRMGDRAKRELGYEVEIDPARDPGGLQAPGTRGWLVRTGPMGEAWYAKPEGWNELAVSARGGRIVIHVNGTKTVDLSGDPGRRKGRFALQINPRQELEVYFADLQILRKVE